MRLYCSGSRRDEQCTMVPPNRAIGLAADPLNVNAIGRCGIGHPTIGGAQHGTDARTDRQMQGISGAQSAFVVRGEKISGRDVGTVSGFVGR